MESVVFKQNGKLTERKADAVVVNIGTRTS